MKNKVLLIPLLLLLAMSLVAIGCPAPAPAPAPALAPAPAPAPAPALPSYHWRLAGSPWAGDHPTTIAFTQFSKDIAEASNGRIIVDYYPGGALGNWTEVVDHVMAGTIEMTDNQAFLTSYDPRMNLAWVPHLFRDWDGAMQAWGQGGWLFELAVPILEGQNQHLLGVYANGFQGIGYTRPDPPKSLAETAGIKLRVNPAKLSTVRYEALGFSPVFIPFVEAYTALETGVADGVGLCPVSEAWGTFRDVYKSYVNARDAFESQAFTMNLELWNSLSPQDQGILTEVANKTIMGLMQTMASEEAGYIEKLNGYGVNVWEPTSEYLEECDQKYVEIVYPWLKDILGEVLVEKILANRIW